MARKKSPPVEPTALTLLKGARRLDEINIGRLGLISVQERIPDDFTSWNLTFEVDGRPAKLSCNALAAHGGVPHGLDGDVFNAILAIFVEQGNIETGDLTVTAHQILKRAGLQTNGRYYGVLHNSLHRLKTASYTATEAWRDHDSRRWTTQTFTHFERMEYTGAQESIGNATIINLRLAHQIVRSVRANYIKPLDADILSMLDRPLSRAVYRFLDAKRYDPADPKLITLELHMPLVQWATECKINDLTPKKIRRTLEPAHEELIANGYLESVEYAGRGNQQTICYRFGDGAAIGLDLVSRLRRHGIGEAVAQTLVREADRELLEERLAKAEFLLVRDRDRIQNRAGFVVSVLRDDGRKYPDPEGFTPPRRATPTSPTNIDSPEVPVVPADDPEDALRRFEQQLRAQGLEAQINYAMERLTLFGRSTVSTLGSARVTIIRGAMERGQLDPLAVAREAMRAAFENRMQDFIRSLLKAANGPLPAPTLLSTVTDDGDTDDLP